MAHPVTPDTRKSSVNVPFPPTFLSSILREAALQIPNNVFSSALYRKSLTGEQIAQALAFPNCYAARHGRKAQEMIGGQYAFKHGAKRVGAGISPWNAKSIDLCKDELWLEDLYAFEWLCHFGALKDEHAVAHGKALIERWIAECPVGRAVAWRPHVLGQRLINWLQFCAEPACRSDADWQLKVFQSLAEQTRHLSRLVRLPRSSEKTMSALTGLVLSAYSFSTFRKYARFGMAKLEYESHRQILADGGHVSRNVFVQFHCLREFLVLTSLLKTLNERVPDWLRDCIERMTAFAKLMRHGDGRFALFNGSDQGDGSSIDQILGQDGARVRIPYDAPQSGYYRLRRGRTNVYVDGGSATNRVAKNEGHASCLAFEFSSGRHRIFVNCGSAVFRGAEWGRLLRRSAAHTTLILNDASSSTFSAHSHLGTGREIYHANGPAYVSAKSVREKDRCFFSGSHTGYLQRFGFLHHRQLELNESGEALLGEDVLESRPKSHVNWFGRSRKAEEAALPKCVLRFHLHPDVQASLLRNGENVLLKLANGDGWIFHTQAGKMMLEESVYFGSYSENKKTQQIVVDVNIPQQEFKTFKILWSLSRLGYERDSNGAKVE